MKRNDMKSAIALSYISFKDCVYISVIQILIILKCMRVFVFRFCAADMIYFGETRSINTNELFLVNLLVGM